MSNNHIIIQTPRGCISRVTDTNGTTATQLTFFPTFSSTWTGTFTKVQKYIDNEVLRLSDPYVPFDTGVLKMSGKLGTVIGSGLVMYVAPYAHQQYYHNAGRGKQGTSKYNTHNYKCLRGKYWFERMKSDHLQDILSGAKRTVTVNNR